MTSICNTNSRPLQCQKYKSPKDKDEEKNFMVLMACACVAVPTFAESNPDKSEPAEKKVRLLLPSILMCIPVSAM